MVQWYAYLLGKWPRDLLGDFEEDAVALFSDLYREAVRERGVFAAFRLWCWAAGQLVVCGLQAAAGLNEQRHVGRGHQAVAVEVSRQKDGIGNR